MAVNTPDVQKILLGKVRDWLNTNHDALNALVPNDHAQKAALTINEIPELSALPNSTEIVSKTAQQAHAILEQFDNQALRENFANEIMPALQVIAISEAIKTDLENNTISLETQAGTFQIKWNHMRNGTINPELENGFSYRTHDGKKLESLDAQNAINSALIDLTAGPLIQGEMAKVIARRLQETDRDADDKINFRDIRAVRQGFLSQTGRLTPNNFIDIATIPAFYKAMELVKDDVEADVFERVMKDAESDIKMAQEAFSALTETQTPAQPDAPAQQKKPPAEKPAASTQQENPPAAAKKPEITKPATEKSATTEEPKAKAKAKPKNETIVLSDYLREEVQYATLLLERAFAEGKSHKYLFYNEPDKSLDPATLAQIRDTLITAVSKYGQEYYDGDKYILGPDDKTRYTFSKEGYIYSYQIIDGKPTDKETIGKITDGLNLEIAEEGEFKGKLVGQIKPNPIVVALINDIRKDLFAVDIDAEQEKLALEQRKLEDKQNRLIEDYFNANPALASLEDEFREALKKHDNADPFKNTAIAKKIREQSADKETFDLFLVAILTNQQSMNELGAKSQNFGQERADISAIANLFRVMSDDKLYDPNKLSELYGKADFKPDNILSLNAYTWLEGYKGDHPLAVEALYLGLDEERKQAILQAFEGKTQVTLQEARVFVRRQIDLRAIKTLDPGTYADAEKAGKLDTIAGQNAFIAANHATLRGVSQAMMEGRFNPDERDVKIAFKAFGTLSIQDPRIRRHINRMMTLTDNTRPNAKYAQYVLTPDELETLTKDKVKELTDVGIIKSPPGTEFKALASVAKEKVLQSILAQPLWNDPGRPGFEAYERLMLQYYESHINNYHAWHNGDVNDQTMDTWNGRYGGPTQDQMMYLYVRNNWHHMNEIFKGDTSFFFNKSGNRFNHGLTYEEAVAQLSPEDRATLDAGMKALDRVSAYTYLVERRPSEKYEDRSYYFELRQDRYVPNVLAADLKNKFGEKADPVAKQEQSGPKKDEDSPQQSLTNKEKEEIPGRPDSNLLEDDGLPPANAAKLATWATSGYGAAKAFNKAGQIAQVVPEASAKHAAAAMKILRIADNAEVGSRKQIDALNRASGLMKEVGLTEAQLRLQGALNGTHPIPESKLDKAGRALKLLVAADNAPQYSPDIARAHELAQKLMDKAGLSETQVRLLGLQNGTEILPEGKEKTANRVLRALEIADNAQTAAKRTQAMESAQRMMKAQGLTEAQVRAFGLAQQNPKAVKELTKINLDIETKTKQPTKANPAAAADTNTTTKAKQLESTAAAKPSSDTPDKKDHIIKRIENIIESAKHPSISEKERASRLKSAERLMKKHGITEDQIKEQTSSKITETAQKDAYKITSSEGKALLSERETSKALTLTTKLDEIPKIEAPNILKRATQGLSKLFKRAGKGGAAISKSVFGGTLAGYAAGAGVGITIAAAETSHLESKHDFLIASNLLTKDQHTALANLYGWYIGSMIADPSTVTSEYLIKDAIKDLGLNPVVTEMVSPDMIIDVLEKGLTDAEVKAIKEQFTDKDKLAEMYTSIAKAHGLPEKVTVEINGKPQEISIGVAMLDPKAAKEIWTKYTKLIPDGNDNSDNPEHITRYVADESVNPTERRGLLYLETVNEMTATTTQMVQEYEKTQEMLHTPSNIIAP